MSPDKSALGFDELNHVLKIMKKHTTWFRSLLDVVVTLAMGAAAVAVLWRMTTSIPARGTPRAGTEKLLAVEDLRDSGLSISLDGTPTKGRKDAPVVMVEFADFECPFCARFVSEKFGRLQEDFVSTGRVQYGFRHTPLKRHPLARPAAQSAECAARQGKFWDAHDYLFNNQAQLALALWFKNDHGIKIDSTLFDACMAEADQARISADIVVASQLKIETTPTFVIGRRLNGGGILIQSRINGNRAYEVFEKALVAAAEAALVPKSGS